MRLKGSLSRNGTPARIIDLLSTELRWLESMTIADILHDRYGLKRNTVLKSIDRLQASGRISSRVSMRDPKGHSLEYFSDEWAVDVA